MKKKKPKKRSRKAWEIELNLLAWKDPEFRRLLLKNPEAVLKKLHCTSGLDPRKVRIIEEDEDVQFVVLYKRPRNAAALSKMELRFIAAGIPDPTDGCESVAVCHSAAPCSTAPSCTPPSSVPSFSCSH